MGDHNYTMDGIFLGRLIVLTSDDFMLSNEVQIYAFFERPRLASDEISYCCTFNFCNPYNSGFDTEMNSIYL